MRRSWLLLTALLSGLFAVAAEGPAADTESFSLMEHWRARRWWCMTSTITQAADRLSWHVLVDYKGGEERHPIGWPLADAYFHDLPEALRDWRQFDRLTFRVKAKISLAVEDPIPIYLQFCEKGGRRLFKTDLEGLVPGKELLISVDLSRVPELEKSSMFRIYLYEGQYRHGDIVELELWDIRLHRSKSIRVEEFFLATPSVFGDSPRLEGEIHLTGPDSLIGKGIPAAIFRHGESKPAAEKLLPLHRGRQGWALDLAPLNLLPGEYEIVLFADSPASRIVRAFTIVSSPWKEASK